MRNRSDPFRLLTSDGHDTNFVLGTSGVEQALSVLAIVEQASRETVGPVVPSDAQGAIVVVSGPHPTVTSSQLMAYGRVMFLTMDQSVWDTNATQATSTTEAVGNEICLRLGSMQDLASVWSRSIATLMSSGSAR